MPALVPHATGRPVATSLRSHRSDVRKQQADGIGRLNATADGRDRRRRNRRHCQRRRADRHRSESDLVRSTSGGASQPRTCMGPPQTHRDPLPARGTKTRRPPNRRAIPGPPLGGEPTETGHPCSMETAARSGALPAQIVAASTGARCRSGKPDRATSAGLVVASTPNARLPHAQRWLRVPDTPRAAPPRPTN
jgi:hypothetical protein